MLLIIGSSKSGRNTKKVAKYLEETQPDLELLDLNDYEFSDFDYSGPFNDDFLKIIDSVLAHKIVIWLTPIYWYTMSAIMKRFLDRFSDLLKFQKSIGRKLRGTSMYVISCSESDDPPENFVEPFQLSASYLGIYFLGYTHAWIENDMITFESKERLSRLFGKSG